jgi:hypothetical protein
MHPACALALVLRNQVNIAIITLEPGQPVAKRNLALKSQFRPIALSALSPGYFSLSYDYIALIGRHGAVVADVRTY